MNLPPYTSLVRGNLFWRPNAGMKAKGFAPMALGPDCEDARGIAAKLYADWLVAKAAQPKVTDYPPGSFGAYYDRFRLGAKFAELEPRSREDYTRAWKHLGPALGDKAVMSIDAGDCEDFILALRKRVSENERYRTVKVLRALLEDAVVRLKLPYKNPALIMKNPQAKGRSAIWLRAEIAKLIQTADRMNYPNMALAIAIGWDTLFSPVDVWSFTRGQIKSDGTSTYIHLHDGRTKTHKEAFGYLTPATATRLETYIKSLPIELTPDAKVIRERSGVPFPDKDRFARTFRRVRNTAFRGDTRTFMDIRRSGNVEADAAGASKEDMGAILANNIAGSAFLDATYTPPTVSKAKRVAELRLEGGTRLAGELMRHGGR